MKDSIIFKTVLLALRSTAIRSSYHHHDDTAENPSLPSLSTEDGPFLRGLNSSGVRGEKRKHEKSKKDIFARDKRAPDNLTKDNDSKHQVSNYRYRPMKSPKDESNQESSNGHRSNDKNHSSRDPKGSKKRSKVTPTGKVKGSTKNGNSHSKRGSKDNSPSIAKGKRSGGMKVKKSKRIKKKSSCWPNSVAVDSFYLVEASSGHRIQTIESGQSLNMPEIERLYGATSFTIECITHGNVKSVSMSDNFGGGGIDNEYPWTLVGNDQLGFKPNPLREHPGFWYVICQPFCGPDATGVAGDPFATMFTVVADEAKQPPVPTVESTATPTSPKPTWAPISQTFPPTTLPTTLPTGIPLRGPSTSPSSESSSSPSLTTALPTASTATRESRAPSTKPTSLPTKVPTLSELARSPASNSAPPLHPANGTPATPAKGTPGTPGSGLPHPTPALVYGLQPNCAVFDGLHFNICLDLSSSSGNPEPWFHLINQAARRWERIIATDPWGPWPADTIGLLPATSVATEIPDHGVDDIYISVFESDLDGPGGLFALAGPDLMLGGANIVAGSIRIDPNDIEAALENNVFMPLMLHEISHVRFAQRLPSVRLL